MSAEAMQTPSGSGEKRSSRFKILLTVVAVAFLTSILTVWLVTNYVFRKQFQPVELSEREVEVLNAKLARLDAPVEGARRRYARQEDISQMTEGKIDASLKPERYDESGAKREVRLTERELNALLARNTNLANRLAIDLSQDQVSAKLLVPLDPDFPFLGGKTLRVTAGVELRYNRKNPVLALKGISLWGVPLPNAWLGGLKNVDLISEFGARGGFWKAFSEGVADVRVEEGNLLVRLNE